MGAVRFMNVSVADRPAEVVGYMSRVCRFGRRVIVRIMCNVVNEIGELRSEQPLGLHIALERPAALNWRY